ncbi:MAG: glycosyltransferase [Parasporobacterium sp.]|nr:glycosyltransferase [Parasporobacterium sp.]MBR3642045.1 glycosyltransferase [Parasporobacterium sp.]
MDKIAVLIPCFNEAPTIEKVVREFQEILPEAVVYVYDNNSTDGTDEIARSVGAVVRYERMQGKGNVVRRMFREIDAQCYLMVDGDDTYSANDAPALANRVINDGADMVIGDRLSSTYFEENKKVLNSFGNILMRKAINSIFRSDIKDIMTGYRAFSFDFVKTFPVTAAGFDIETEMTIHAIDKKLQIDHVTVDYQDRKAESVSKLHPVRDGLKAIGKMLSLSKNFRPVACFGLIALILFVIAAVFLFPILVEYFQTGLVPRFPTLIVCGFLILTAIISLFAGVLLSNIVQKNRRDFEIARLMVHGRYSDLMKENVEEVLCQDSKAAEMDQEFRRR